MPLTKIQQDISDAFHKYAKENNIEIRTHKMKIDPERCRQTAETLRQIREANEASKNSTIFFK